MLTGPSDAVRFLKTRQRPPELSAFINSNELKSFKRSRGQEVKRSLKEGPGFGFRVIILSSLLLLIFTSFLSSFSCLFKKNFGSGLSGLELNNYIREFRAIY